MIDHLFVYLDNGTDAATMVGEAFFTARSGKLATTFRYDARYLVSSHAFPVDPRFDLDTGAQYVSGLPGAFQDCSPDRWGRNLIIKRSRSFASRSTGSLPTLTDVDFLVEVSDVTRQGALRFRNEEDGPFLGEGARVPELIELPRLLRASDQVDRDGDFASIKELLEAGTGSLGGASPKASVRNGNQLLIAKFPHPHDEYDVMGWEKTVLDLASSAGIRVPRTSLVRIDGRSVLLLNRFDRQDGRRVPYISAMTLLGSGDGDASDYTEIAEHLSDVGAMTTEDLHELWRRMAFSVLINNTDDHLRNHGFLREPGGWRLSPVFDINPNPDTARSRQTGIAGSYHRDGAIEAMMTHASDFRLNEPDATKMLGEVTQSVGRWREVAKANSLPERELTLFAEVFES